MAVSSSSTIVFDGQEWLSGIMLKLLHKAALVKPDMAQGAGQTA